jgi:hypothetical protein
LLTSKHFVAERGKGYLSGVRGVCFEMTTTHSENAPIPTPAQIYRRAHAGKLMVVEPTADRLRVARDFFHLESVGSHPSGLFVTGKFAGGRIESMRASAVRDANEEELASLRSGSGEESSVVSEPGQLSAESMRAASLDNGR